MKDGLTQVKELKDKIHEQYVEIQELNKRAEDLKTINEEHQILNGMLRKENDRLNTIINELDKQNGELGADLSIIKDRVIKTNWWLEKMLKQATNKETKAIINGTLDLLLGSDKE